MKRVREWLVRALCSLGLHEFEVTEVQIGFGPGGSVEKVRCRQCGYRRTRRARS